MPGQSAAKPAPTNDGTAHMVEAIRQGDRRALARAITLIESTRPDHRTQAESLLADLLPFAGNSFGSIRDS